MFFQFPLKALQNLFKYTTGISIENHNNIGTNLRIDDANNNTTMASNSSSFSVSKIKIVHLLAERSLNLLLILLHNKRLVLGGTSISMANPVREIFCLLNDEQLCDESEETDDIEMMGKQSQSRRIHIDFKGLVASLTSNLPSESYTLLLYSFLQLHPTFIESLIATESIEPILTAILKGLYDSNKAKSVDHLYALIVCVLMMVQESSLRSRLSDLKANPIWYSERSLVNIPLLDLTILCILRAIMHALFRLKGDQFLLSNCFAVLLNIAPYIGNMSSYTAERVVNVIRRICKRIISEYSASESSPSKSISDNESNLLCVALQNTLTVLLRLIGVALR